MHGHQIEHELAQLVLTPKDAQSVSQLFYGPKPALIPPPALNPAFDDVQLTRRRLLRGTLFFSPFIFQHLSLKSMLKS